MKDFLKEFFQTLFAVTVFAMLIATLWMAPTLENLL